MSTKHLAQIETLDKIVIPQITLDPSCRAPLWFLFSSPNLSERGEIISAIVNLTHFDISESGLEDSSMRLTESIWQETISYKPKTPLGKRLWEIRSRIVASGEPLLGWEEIEQEVAARRGEIE